MVVMLYMFLMHGSWYHAAMILVLCMIVSWDFLFTIIDIVWRALHPIIIYAYICDCISFLTCYTCMDYFFNMIYAFMSVILIMLQLN